jgi:hypothetical protein
MHKFITIASAAALVATASASASAFNLNSSCQTDKPLVRIHNRCNYAVHLWSVVKGQGCPDDDGAYLEPGDFYQENYRPAVDKSGTSIKIAKTSSCGSAPITQLEYYIETENPGFNYNYLDVSYVNCLGLECPTRQEGFYLKSGNDEGKYMANALNEICPILSCDGPESCAEVAYVNPDDRQTKSCDPEANLEFWMCGSEPGSEPTYAAPAASSSPAAESTQQKAPAPSSTSEAAYSSVVEVKAAAVTPAPVPEEHKPLNIKTEIVYVTKYADAKREEAKRHAHAHGHRHQHFKA